MAEEPKELHPLVLFNMPRLGQQYVRDFRPLPVASNDAMPPANGTRPPAPVAEEADPKLISSATGSAQPSEPGSSEMVTNGQTISSQAGAENPVTAEKESPLTAEDSSLQKTSPPPGGATQPVALTGQTHLGLPPLSGTLSTPSVGNA